MGEVAVGGLDCCRGCASTELEEVLDLGSHPLAEWFPTPEEIDAGEPRWALRVVVCRTCWLLQLDGRAAPDPPSVAVDPYAVSDTMRAHARGFAQDVAAVAGRGPTTVVETASHGGHLHRFLGERDLAVTVLERDPAVAGRVEGDGTATLSLRLDRDADAVLDGLGRPADVVVDAFMLAHVPQPDAYFAGAARILAPGGTLVLEFDHLLPVLRDARYDSVRHGHFTYLSLGSVRRSMERHGLEPVRASAHGVYGGTLRVIARRRSQAAPVDPSVEEVMAAERAAGLDSVTAYRSLADRAGQSRDRIREFLRDCAAERRSVVGYGAPSRGNTLLNFAGVTARDLPFTVDASPAKHGRLMPGSRIPIRPPTAIDEARPDFVLVLPWDLRAEIQRDLARIAAWGGRLVVPMPALEVLPS